MRQVLDTPAPARKRSTLAIRGPWDAGQAAAFGFGPREAAPDGTLRLAFVRDDLEGHAGAVVSPPRAAGPSGTEVALELHGDVPDPDLVTRQVARILSLDHDAGPWTALAAADPILAAAHARRPGLRPVLFPSPWEAAIWAVLSQRRQAAQARALHVRLASALGATLHLAGVPVHALPTPGAVLGARELPVPDTPARRLRALAAAALDGALDPGRLRDLPAGQALDELQRLPGIGPFSAGLVLVRSAGVADVLPPREPRVRRAAARAAGDPSLAAGEDAFRAAAAAWRPWRTWACVLLRADAQASGDG